MRSSDVSNCLRIALVASVVVILAGCTPTTSVGPSPSPSATASVDPQPSPTASDDPTGRLAVGDLVATPDGIADSQGQLLVAVTKPIVPGDPALAVVEWDDTVCDEPEAGPETGGWKPAFPLTDDGKYPFFPNMAARTMDSPVQWISVQEPQIRTAEGLGVGSTVAELEAEYGADLVVGTSFDSTSHALYGSVGQLVFWSQKDEKVFAVDVIAGFAPAEFYYTTTPCA